MKKNIFSLVFLAMLTILTVSCGVASTDESNDESTNEPNDGSTDSGDETVYTYFINTADDLMALSGKEVIENIKFEADIIMTDKTDFKGIALFDGEMNGNGKKIIGLNITATGSGGAGLIIKMMTGKIKNLTIESGLITDDSGGSILGEAGDGVAGAFVVVVPSKAMIKLEGLVNKATVRGNLAGGIIGNTFGATIIINNTKNFGDVTGSGAGGIIGNVGADSTITINNAENSGKVIGDATAGGIIGVVNNDNATTINNTKNLGDVTTLGVGGGIIGDADGIIIITNTVNSGNIYGVNGGGGIGGIIGTTTYGNITITNAGNSGAATNGGILGNAGVGSTITIDKIYNYETMPIVFLIYGDATVNITNSFYLEGGADTVGATEATAIQFKDPSTFIAKGWNFNTVWKMDSVKGYPVIQ